MIYLALNFTTIIQAVLALIAVALVVSAIRYNEGDPK